jgi:hypothetical protein
LGWKNTQKFEQTAFVISWNTCSWNVNSWSVTSWNAFNTHLLMEFISSWNDTVMKFKKKREKERLTTYQPINLATYPDLT